MGAKAFVLARFLADSWKTVVSPDCVSPADSKGVRTLFLLGIMRVVCNGIGRNPAAFLHESAVASRRRSGEIGSWSVGLHDAFERLDSIRILIGPWNCSHAGVGLRGTRLCRSVGRMEWGIIAHFFCTTGFLGLDRRLLLNRAHLLDCFKDQNLVHTCVARCS